MFWKPKPAPQPKADKVADDAISVPVPTKTENVKEPEPPKDVDDEIPPPSEQDIPQEDMLVSQAAPIQEKEPETASAEDGEKPFTQWNNVLKELVKTCPLLVGVLKDSSAFINGDYLLIDYKNEQFLQMIKQPLYKDHLKKAAFDVTGKAYKLGPHKTVAPKAPDVLGTITGKLSKLGIPDDENK